MKRLFFPALLLACEVAEKDPEGPANYTCTMSITGTDSEGNFQTLLESTSDIDCRTSEEKNDFMEEACDLDMENYIGEYTGLDCSWNCTPLDECP